MDSIIYIFVNNFSNIYVDYFKFSPKTLQMIGKKKKKRNLKIFEKNADVSKIWLKQYIFLSFCRR